MFRASVPQNFPRQPPSMRFPSNFPCPALSAGPVFPDNVRHSGGATSSCSCQTTTARKGAQKRSRRRARTRRISSRPGTTGPGHSVRILSNCRAGPAAPTPQRRDAFIRFARLPIRAIAGVSRLKRRALGIHARYPALALDTRCALPCATPAPAKAFKTRPRATDGLLAGLSIARRRQRPLWSY